MYYVCMRSQLTKASFRYPAVILGISVTQLQFTYNTVRILDQYTLRHAAAVQRTLR